MTTLTLLRLVQDWAAVGVGLILLYALVWYGWRGLTWVMHR